MKSNLCQLLYKVTYDFDVKAPIPKALVPVQKPQVIANQGNAVPEEFVLVPGEKFDPMQESRSEEVVEQNSAAKIAKERTESEVLAKEGSVTQAVSESIEGVSIEELMCLADHESDK